MKYSHVEWRKFPWVEIERKSLRSPALLSSSSSESTKYKLNFFQLLFRYKTYSPHPVSFLLPSLLFIIIIIIRCLSCFLLIAVLTTFYCCSTSSVGDSHGLLAGFEVHQREPEN